MIRGVAKYILLLLVVSVGVLGKHGTAIDPDLGIPLFLKVITYDENFDPEKIDAVNISIVYDRAQVQSYEQLRRIESYLKENSGLMVSGVAVTYQSVPSDEIDSALATLDDSQYNLMIVTSVGSDRVASLSSKAQIHLVRTFSLDPEYVALGISVGVKVRKKGQLIMVNLDSSRREGSQFSAHLLRLCEIVGSES